MDNKILEDFINDCEKMIAIPSVIAKSKPNRPFGDEIDLALQTILEICIKLGLETYADPQGYYGYAEVGAKDAELFGVLCHVDVVPASDLENWKTNPFELKVVDDKLYGRGIQDDKGPTLLCLYALKSLLDQGYQLKKRIRFIFGTDEECLWRCMANYNKKEEIPQSGIVPDSVFPVTNAEKGLLQFDLITHEEIDFEFSGGEAYNSVAAQAQISYDEKVENKLKTEKIDYSDKNGFLKVFGASFHVKDADKGDNAIVKLARVLKECNYQSNLLDFIVEKGANPCGELLFGEVNDDVSGKLKMNLGRAEFKKDQQIISLDMRIPVTYPHEKIMSVIKEACESYKLDYKQVDYVKALYVSEGSLLVKKLMKAYQSVTDDYKTKPLASGGATYARTMDNFVAFGADLPTSKTTAHQANEHVAIADYQKAFAVYVEAFKLLIF